MKTFSNLHEAQRFFKDEDTCWKYWEQIRWNGKPVCPHCGSANKPYKLKQLRRYKCSDKDCYKKFTAIVGTVFESTKLPLQKWFLAIYLATAHKKGISSYQLSRDLGISQTTAWFALHRIREMMRIESPVMLSNTVEIDECYVAGKINNKHKWQRDAILNRTSPVIKPTVLGMLERSGSVITEVVKDVDSKTVIPVLNWNISPQAVLITDASRIYQPIEQTHHVINHDKGEYVNGMIHTNGIEGYWSLLKRGIIGIYHQVSAKHLQRYCDEFSYRYNTRQISDAKRFSVSMQGAEGKRLKYKNLIAKNA